MFHKVVVALDYSEFASPIFEEAVSLAKVMGAQLQLIHVLSLEDAPGYQLSLYAEGYYPPLTEDNLYHREWTEFKNQSLHHLEADVESANVAGVSAEFSQLYGSPGKSICESARHWGADLILMGRRGRTGLSELFLGSVSNYVLHHAHCAVLTLNTPSQPLKEVARAESLTTEV
jgi:nucleotide-binding universal stress UspA family protein